LSELLGAERSFLSYQFALIKQLAFANVSTVTWMDLAGGSIGAQCYFTGFIMRAALGTALLTVASFWIWHINEYYKCSIMILFKVFETFQSFPDRVIGGWGRDKKKMIEK